MRVSSGFHVHGHGQTHAGQYGVPAQSAYGSSLGHSGLAFARPLPMRAPVLAPAGFNHHQHPGQHQHGRTQNQSHTHSQNPNYTMADPYMASDDEIAHLQKLSSEYEPEATVSLLVMLLAMAEVLHHGSRPPLTVAGTASGRAPEQRSHHDAVCQRRPCLPGQDSGAAQQVRLLSHLPW